MISLFHVQLSASTVAEEEGGFSAICPELGIASQGETEDEAVAALEDAVSFWLEDVTDEELRRRYKPTRNPSIA